MYAYTNIPDKVEIFFLRDLVENQKKSKKSSNIIFLDIGANIGSYSVSMMDVCDSVIAFEPHPYTANRCKMNFLLNNFAESNVKQLALSDSIGKIGFSDYGGSSSINHIVSGGNIEVPVTTLDNFIFEQKLSNTDYYVIKVDVEGFEKQVFTGGKKFLTNFNVLGIVFECFTTEDVFSSLQDCGYKNIIQLSQNNYYATKN